MPAVQRFAGERPLVLIVDDHDDTCEVCAFFLERVGFEAIASTSVTDAIGLMLAHRPQAVITDLAMPGMDGWALIGAIRSDPALCDVPIIVSSGYVDQATQQRALFEGCDAFIGKPCNYQDLAETLTALLDRRAQRVGARGVKLC